MKAEKAIRGVSLARADFLALYNRSDPVALNSFYTMDSLIIPPNSDPIKGLKAIFNFWKSLMDMGIETLKMKGTEIEVMHETVIETSQFDMIDGGLSIVDSGNHLAIWKTVGGAWKISKDVFNSARPAQ